MGIRVREALYGGNFATDDGGTHPFVLPGELIGITAYEVEVMLETSDERATPPCIHFGRCGGCQYQHANYVEQRRLKEEILKGLLRNAGLADFPQPESHAAEPWGYRNRIRMRVQSEASAGAARAFEVGYSRRASNEFLSVQMCPIAAPVLWRAAEALKRLGREDALCGRWMEAASEVELFCTGDECRVQMQFFLRDSDVAQQNALGFVEFCERVQVAVPELVGAGAVLDPELSRKRRKAWNGTEWGASGLGYEVSERSYWVSRGAFFQVNRFLVGRLVGLVTEGKSGLLAWDLYAGVGLFSRALAEHFDRVVAVEGGEAAATDLARAALAKGQVVFEAVRAPILDFLRAGSLQRERPELVVLDPPRAGLGREGCELLSRIGPPIIVYVSCDPVTLVRDLAVLTKRGYDLVKVDLIDLFPQTFHLETVVMLHRV